MTAVTASVSRHRLLHLITRLDVGGAQDNTLATVEGRDRDKYEVHVAARPGGRWEERAARAADRFIPIPHLCAPLRPISDLQAYFETRRVLRAGNYDLVHTHSSKAGVIGRFASRGLATGVVHTIHGFPFHQFMPRWKQRLFVGLERRACQRCDHVVTLSEADRQEGIRLGVVDADRSSVVFTGVDFGKLEPKRARQQIRQEFGTPSEAPVIVNVGRLDPQKAQRLLIDAFASLAREFPTAECWLVGEGECQGELVQSITRHRLDRRVKLLGLRSDVADILAAADVFAFSSLWEAMGRALIEAMCVGKAVIAPAIYGIPELVQHGERGLLYPVSDVGALADCLRRYLRDPSLGVRHGMAARKFARSHFDATQMVRRLEAIYERVLAKKSARLGRGCRR